MSEINIIEGLTVRLVGRLSIDESELAGFLSDEDADTWTTDTDNAAQKLVEVAGRLCYKSYARPRPGGNSAYLGHILEVAHGSVVEHACYNFIITGVSRSFSHELVRHRAGWSYSQRSQRFCDESELSVVVPPEYRREVAAAREYIARVVKRPNATALDVSMDMRNMNTFGADIEAGLVWLELMETANRAYAFLSDYGVKKLQNQDYAEWEKGLPEDTASNGYRLWLEDQGRESRTLRRKRAREAARSVLPNATETQIFVTVNARAARHFIEARANEHADAEIRAVALKMLDLLLVESPNLFGDYAVEDRPGIGPVASTPHRKV